MSAGRRATEKVPAKKARSRRRGFPIRGYVGPNGGGKSLCAVYDALPSLAAGRPVASTVRLIDPATGDDHPLWIPLGPEHGGYARLLDLEYCDIILDEVTGVASSRGSMTLPAPIANLLVQLRRRDVTLSWTAPNWKRADTIIRETSQGVTLCMGFFGKTVEAPSGEDRQWTSKRLFYWRSYDAAAFDEWSTYQKNRVRPAARQLYRFGSSPAPYTYDTFDAVATLGDADEYGHCLDCGGTRSRPKCRCSPTLRVPKVDPAHDGGVLIPETDDTPGVFVDLTRPSVAVGSS